MQVFVVELGIHALRNSYDNILAVMHLVLRWMSFMCRHVAAVLLDLGHLVSR